MLGTSFSVLTLTTICKVDTYLYPHFIDRKTEVQSLNNFPKATLIMTNRAVIQT